VKHLSSWQQNVFKRSPSFCEWSLLCARNSTLLWFILYHIVHQELPTTILVPRACQRTELHPAHWLWLDRVANIACNYTVATIKNPLVVVYKSPLTTTVILENTPIYTICRMGMVTLLHSSQIQALCNSTTILHSSSHTTVCNQQPLYSNEFQVIGHSGKNMTST